MASRETLISDTLLFLKDLISSNIDDPRQIRSKDSSFVMTTFAQRHVEYPLITVELTNYTGNRAGMQSTAMDVELTIEVRVYSKSITESDKLTQQILDLLADEQFTVEGSIDNDFHHLTIGSSVRVDEPGTSGVKSRITQLNYQFFNI